MAKLRFKVTSPRGQFAAAMVSIKTPIAFAATAAISDAADIAKREGRADIAAAGFSKKWQNALRTQVYPRRKTSMNASALIWHKIGYSNIFEEGATITGKPRLWLPLQSAPQRLGRQKMTPSLYVKSIGPLVTIKRPGKPPLLAGQIATNRRGQGKATKGKVTLSALKRGAGGAPSKLVPLFVGIDRVNIRDRFSIRQITERVAGRLGELYLKNLNPDM